ncbi:MAG: sulfide/dihydroorotate dehydrogenase-like FAD/NAD-binding protein [Oscillospiraceae bacterium]|jgi:ferredoxin--NADP+ reductase|nr:sulfide/dihydroorotate dehydrogenase-like FAD/NAD-binding protein [Oscillospiraceae bacterium]
MYRIIKKKVLNPATVMLEFDAPLIARRALPGQFVILRVDESGERVPFTIADSDSRTGAVSVIFQIAGYSTQKLAALSQGESVLDLVGPLGRASELDGYDSAAVIGGGLGIAIAYPQARALYERGAKTDVIVGFRTQELTILREELSAVSSELTIMTDDGSNGNKGFVTTALERKLEAGEKYDVVVAIGPLPMMKAVCDLTRGYGIRTIVSMNSVMIDGTGMCGCCRVTVDGERKFACVDGPDFDGHLIDFEEAAYRARMFAEEERVSRETHVCNITGGVRS